MSIDELSKYFDEVRVSPDGWPAYCNLVHPNETSLNAFPLWPESALLGAGRVGSGRGLTHGLSIESGVGSAIELASACRWPDLVTAHAREDQLSDEVWNPRMLCGFSETQLSRPDKFNANYSGVDEILDAQSEEIDWIQGVGLQGQPIWLPADSVFINDESTQVFSRTDTNGCAAGQTDDQARSAALFELIERDATGRWWYGCRSRPTIEARLLGSEVEAFIERCKSHDMVPTLVNITTDLEVPSVAATGVSARGHIAFGFASAPTYRHAALSALCEMAQMFLVIKNGAQEAHRRPGLARWLSEVSIDTPPISSASPAPSPLPNEPRSIGNRLSAAGIRVAFVDLTRPEFNLPVWRAISPDLCHWKPRFGIPRLMQADALDLSPIAKTPNKVVLRL